MTCPQHIVTAKINQTWFHSFCATEQAWHPTFSKLYLAQGWKLGKNRMKYIQKIVINLTGWSAPVCAAEGVS